MKAFIFIDDPSEGDMLKPIVGYAGLEVIIGTNLKPVLENWPQDSAEIILLAADDSELLTKNIVEVRATTQVPLLILLYPKG